MLMVEFKQSKRISDEFLQRDEFIKIIFFGFIWLSDLQKRLQPFLR